MRIHVLSDLHLERAPCQPPPVACDVVVLAGDIHPGVEGVRWARETFPHLPVLYVAGNHELWGHGLPQLYDDLRAAAEGSRVRVLERDAVTIDGVRFLGTTLWTDFALFDRPAADARAARGLPDFRHITFGSPERRLRPEDSISLHEESRAFLEAELAAGDLARGEGLASPAGPTVVITHHAPHRRSTDPRFAGHRSCAAFSSHLEDLIRSTAPTLWIHGHLHWSFDYQVGSTRILCNPRGYPGEATGGFDPGLVVDVGGAGG